MENEKELTTYQKTRQLFINGEIKTENNFYCHNTNILKIKWKTLIKKMSTMKDLNEIDKNRKNLKELLKGGDHLNIILMTNEFKTI